MKVKFKTLTLEDLEHYPMTPEFQHEYVYKLSGCQVIIIFVSKYLKMNQQQDPAERLSSITIGSLLIESQRKRISLTIMPEGPYKMTYKGIVGIKDHINITGIH